MDAKKTEVDTLKVQIALDVLKSVSERGLRKQAAKVLEDYFKGK